MADILDVGLVQINSKENKDENLTKAEEMVAEAASRGAKLVALPEYVDYLGEKEGVAAIADPIPGETTNRFASWAKKHGIFLLAGSVHERVEGEDDRYFNASTLFSPEGELLATYRKIHLFDVTIGDNVKALESEKIMPGERAVVAQVGDHTIGMSVCYDLRFPELYRRLVDLGAEILFVPAAFTMFTGKDHWELLLRARAVENQAFVVAPGQCGRHKPDGWTYGRSMVIDPWGVVIAQASDGEGVTMARIDFDLVKKFRTEVPSLANRRSFS